jgi:hypothetical protein
MQLLMAVNQRVARIIRYEIHLYSIERHQIHDILPQPAQPRIVDARHLERVAMEMDGVLISTAVA